MSGNAALEMSIFEKIGDKFSSLSEGLLQTFTRIFGTDTERKIRTLGYHRSRDPKNPATIQPGSLLARINALEPQMHALTDAGIKEQTVKFRERIKAGETLDDLLPEAFAACREAALRSKGMRHYDVQMIGGIFLHQGCIAEMVTGEGKTLVATLPAYLNALLGKGVHVVTVNDYLARRDCEWMLPIYSALGVSASFIQSDMDPVDRHRAYQAEITYGTSSEFGFDYLRDNMKPARSGDTGYHPYYQQVQHERTFAIIDEVDNILIDEARTPLIISGPAHSDLKRYEQSNQIAVTLTDLEKRARAERLARGETELPGATEQGEKPQLGIYFEIKEKERTCHLTDLGIRKAEELAGVESFYTAGNMEWPHLIDNSLKAHHLYHKDRHYLVMDHEGERKIVIIDEFTGRALFGRQWSDGLHQAVEAKHRREGVQIKQETQTLATVTLQNYFKLYKKLAGMTGTAMTEAAEFMKIYGLDVVAIPTNRVLKRVNFPDLVLRTDKEKWDAVVNEVVEINALGRPILIGTTDVAKSEKLSALLKRRGIKHELLNAKPENVAREADIVAQAGRRGAVTIATNMAGRGTDIILGGNPETLAWTQLKGAYPTRLEVPEDVWKQTVEAIEAKEKMREAGRQIAELGGLHIIGTERHESRRIDNQLRGRAGRQGDPGSSRFYLSLQDDLMRLFAGEWVSAVLARLGMSEGQAIESKMVSRRIEGAQRKVEEYHFDQRKNLLEYDEVMDVQRKRVYGQRQQILNDRNARALLMEMIDKQAMDVSESYLSLDYGPSSFAQFATNRLGIEFDASDFRKMTFEEAEAYAKERAINYIPTVIQEAVDENLSEDEDPKEWKWQEMARVINARYGTKFTDRSLKAIGRENVSTAALEEGTRAINASDFTDGARYLSRDWGLESLIDWARQKFQVTLTLDEVRDKSDSQIQILLKKKIREAYRQKDIEFPVQVGMATYMNEKASGTGQKYDRAGLLRWASTRFLTHASELKEEDFLTQSRQKLRDLLLALSAKAYPTSDPEKIEEKLEDAFSGTRVSEDEDAKELAEWMQQTFAVIIEPEELKGVSREEAQQRMLNAFDRKYRPEMHRMERNLVLEHLDSSWKKHLLTMDHLRSGIQLWGFAQVDPKTKYKQEGQAEFRTMWTAMEDRITDSVFRVQDLDDEAYQDIIQWSSQTAFHAQAQSLSARAANTPRPEEMTTNSSEAPRKLEPIRNKGEKIGRNDPCPCGSGKKYKNCHMKAESPSGK